LRRELGSMSKGIEQRLREAFCRDSPAVIDAAID
jgi:hypothetical protein